MYRVKTLKGEHEMKAFFEEYGFVLVAIIVVMLLVGMSSTVGNSVKQKITGMVDAIQFTASVDESGNVDADVTYTQPE